MINARRVILIFFLLLLCAAAMAQQPIGQEEPEQPTYATKKKEAQGPRAIALLEWTAKGPELIPIAIRLNKQFYDAGVYQAQPIPMALDTGVVYEVQKAGEPLGDFTLQLAQQQPSGGWVGTGKFVSKEEQAKRKAELDKAAAASAAAKAAEETKDERPVLKRSGASAKEAPKPTSTDSSKPSSTTAPATDASSTKAAQPAASSATKDELHETETDPNRPILKRGKPQEEQAASIADKTPTKKPVPPPPGLSKYQVAVSDAAEGEVHPYVWHWSSAEEEQKMKTQAEKMALAAVADYSVKTGGPKPGKLEDVKIEAYDLSYSNAPDIILTARVLPDTSKVPVRRGAKAAAAPEPVGALEYYVTVVGREDIYAKLQKSFAVATDNKHLDAFPRMEMIDAVDADGDGTGDLLFRSTTDTGSSFVIYREAGYRLDELIRVQAPRG
jgi:hypothetical protein